MKKREIIKIVIIVIILFILIGAFIIYKDNKNGYVAHYYIDNYKYDIKVKGKSLNITKNYIDFAKVFEFLYLNYIHKCIYIC